MTFSISPSHSCNSSCALLAITFGSDKHNKSYRTPLLTNHRINGGIKWLLYDHLSGKIVKTYSSSLGWLQAIPRDFIKILSGAWILTGYINRLFIGKNLLSAIYQGLALSELINLKTFVGILSGLWGFFIHQSKKRVCIILVTKVRDLTKLTIRMLHCLANFIKTV
jgi:hypothetical protein